MLVLHVEGQALTGARTFDLRMFQHLSLPSAVQRWVFLAFVVGFGAGLLRRVPLVAGGCCRRAGGGRARPARRGLSEDGHLRISPVESARCCLTHRASSRRRSSRSRRSASSTARWPRLRQTSWTRVLAYASLSHLCLVLLGAFALTPDGLTGSAVHQINHGVSIAALFLVAGLVADRVQGAALADYGGLLNAMPLVAAVSLLMTLSLVGIPKLEWLCRHASDRREGSGRSAESGRSWPSAGMALSGVALFWLFSRTMLGELRSPAAGAPKDLRLTRSPGVRAARGVCRLGRRLAGAAAGAGRDVGGACRDAGQPAVRAAGRRLPDTARRRPRRYGPARWHGARGAVRGRNR